MNKFFSLALSALVFASCQNAPDDAETLEPATAPAEVSVAPVPATADSNAINLTPMDAAPSTTAPASPAANKATAGANPEHGQPGHRCDIPVGAPLNSPPGTAPATAVPTAKPAPAAMTVQPSAPAKAQPAAGGQRLNPPHGQPGHDCAVAVGAPLNG